LSATLVRTTIWQGERVVIVEDIPAHVCPACVDQFYDDDVSDALRRLAESGFPADQATREIRVPVFSLAGRIVARAALPDDSYVD
jgi:YgiT-type zinc finger domain-containing protein